MSYYYEKRHVWVIEQYTAGRLFGSRGRTRVFLTKAEATNANNYLLIPGVVRKATVKYELEPLKK